MSEGISVVNRDKYVKQFLMYLFMAGKASCWTVLLSCTCVSCIPCVGCHKFRLGCCCGQHWLSPMAVKGCKMVCFRDTYNMGVEEWATRVKERSCLVSGGRQAPGHTL